MNARTGRGQSNSLKAADGEESRGDWWNGTTVTGTAPVFISR